MKGIILAGGNGTRLHPLTRYISKHLLPIYDKPMIYYPLATLMQSNINEILIISTPHDTYHYEKLFGNGKNLGISISYAVQPKPEGIAQAFTIGEKFIGNDSVALILGDNLFYGYEFQKQLTEASTLKKGAIVFGYYVQDPERFGVIEFSNEGKVLSIEEKPPIPKSNYAVTGLYFYDNHVVEYAKSLTKSSRGEYEITHINQKYLSNDELTVHVIPEGNFWIDAGTHASLFLASQLVKNIEEIQNIKIGCIEEIAYKQGYINKEDLLNIAIYLQNSSYGKYLLKLANT